MRIAVYFATLAAAATGLMLAALVVLVVAVTLVESAGDLTAAPAGGSAAFWLAVYSAVQYGYEVLPIACFMGTLVAGTTLAHRGELLAAQAAGMSHIRLAIAFLAVTLLSASLGVACGETLVPPAIAGVVRVQHDELQRTSPLTQFYNRRLTWFHEGDLLLYLPEVDVEEGVFDHPVAYRFEESMIAEVIEAEALRHDEQGWLLVGAVVRRVSDATATEVESLRLPLKVQPADLIDVAGDPRQLTSGEISALIGRRRKAGFDATAHLIELHNRMAMPLSAIWMFLLIAPWALHPSRRRSMAVSLGSGVIIVAILLSATQICRVLALGHKIPVPLGAWGSGLVTLALLPLSFWGYHRYRVRGSVF